MVHAQRKVKLVPLQSCALPPGTQGESEMSGRVNGLETRSGTRKCKVPGPGQGQCVWGFRNQGQRVSDECIIIQFNTNILESD